MKKNLSISIIVLIGVLILGGGFFIIGRGKKEASLVRVTPTPEAEIKEIPLTERPFVSLTPRADGRELTLEIKGIKDVKTIEYELTYLSNDLTRGVVGSIEPKGENSILRKLLLGTCSRNVCRYDENVTEGTLLLRFRGREEGVAKFISEFNFQKGIRQLTSKDGKFKLTGSFPAGVYFITMSTLGLPAPVQGEILAGPYGVFSSGSQTVKNGKVEILTESPSKIYFFDGKKWNEVIDSSVSSLGIFVALQK